MRPLMPAGPRLVVAVLAAVVAGAGGGAARAAWLQPRIVNGVLTSAFPSTVAVLEGGDPANATASCTGTLIGCRTVLTAAHCVCGQHVTGAHCVPPPGDHTVFLQHAGFFTVEAIAVHPAYDFPAADLALVRLAAPVTGVAPAKLVEAAPGIGTTGTVVGFGRSGDVREDYGLKRVGGVVLTDCASQDLPNDGALCFEFPGPPGANTCNGDSGGPLLVDAGAGFALAGVTSGGTRDDCLAGDQSWDTSVAYHRAWIAEQVGEALGLAACGPGPQAGGPDTTVVGITGELGATAVGTTHRIDVPTGATRLLITMNAEETVMGADFDLLVQAGREPVPGDAACSGRQPNQYAACELADPAPGPWFLRVVRERGSGRYQLTATGFGVGPGTVAACGNGIREADEICDGGDAAACGDGCTPTCVCASTPPCESRRVDVRRLTTRHRLSVAARLLDNDGDLAGLDPSRANLVVALDDGTSRVQVTIPAGDPGWARAAPARRVWRWRGEIGGLRAVRLRDRTARRGRWHARIRGRLLRGAAGLDPRRVRLSVTLGGRCVTE